MCSKSTVLIATLFCFLSTSAAAIAATINLPGALIATPAAVSLAGNDSGNLDFIADIPEFIPTLGTLVSANISIQFSVSSTADVLAPPPELGAVYVVGYTLVTSNDVLPVNGYPAVLLPGMPTPAIPVADPGGPTPTLTPATSLATGSGNIPAAFVPSLQGNAGFLTVNFSMPVSFLAADQTLYVLDGVATASGSLSVSYTYTPTALVTTAEPQSALLLLLGGVGACLLACRRV